MEEPVQIEIIEDTYLTTIYEAFTSTSDVSNDALKTCRIKRTTVTKSNPQIIQVRWAGTLTKEDHNSYNKEWEERVSYTYKVFNS